MFEAEIRELFERNIARAKNHLNRLLKDGKTENHDNKKD